MKCNVCGKEIDTVITSVFQRDGSDIEFAFPIFKCEENANYFETDPNWCGYELTESEQIERISCPHCRKFPFKQKEVQVYDIVRVVCFSK